MCVVYRLVRCVRTEILPNLTSQQKIFETISIRTTELFESFKCVLRSASEALETNSDQVEDSTDEEKEREKEMGLTDSVGGKDLSTLFSKVNKEIQRVLLSTQIFVTVLNLSKAQSKVKFQLLFFGGGGS